jgi:hypothetical protein
MITITTTLVEGDGTVPKNVGIDAVVMFNASTNTGNSFEWEIVSKPENSNAVLTSPQTSITRLGPLDYKGVYHVRLWINKNAADQKSRMISVSVPSIVSPLPAPSAPLFEAGGGRVRNWSFELPGVLPGYASDWLINDEAGILASQGGVTRGRSIPTNFTPTSGRYAMVIGDDLCLDDTFPVGAKFEVSQEVDLTNINQLELDARVKLCPSGPTPCAGAWDCWWYFKGTGVGPGPLFDCLALADNADFEFNSGDGTFLMGVLHEYTNPNQYFISHEDAYYMRMTCNHLAPAANPRDLIAGVQRVAPALWTSATVNNITFPAERSIFYFYWRHAFKTVLTLFYDSTGIHTNSTVGLFNTATTDPATDIHIGVENAVPGNTTYMNGRAYFFAWYKGSLITAVDVQDIYNGVTHPTDLGPTCYIDFSKATPAANYVSEVGGYNWTVHGTPTLNG